MLRFESLHEVGFSFLSFTHFLPFNLLHYLHSSISMHSPNQPFKMQTTLLRSFTALQFFLFFSLLQHLDATLFPRVPTVVAPFNYLSSAQSFIEAVNNTLTHIYHTSTTHLPHFNHTSTTLQTNHPYLPLCISQHQFFISLPRTLATSEGLTSTYGRTARKKFFESYDKPT